jgi:cell wall-associated NlpC family hydrolase
VTDVQHRVLATLRAPKYRDRGRRLVTTFTVAALATGTLGLATHGAGASGLSNDRTKANVLLKQINRINGEVDLLGQKYDEAQIKLQRFNNEIANTKATVAAIQGRVLKGNSQLRADVIFAYVTNGVSESTNPLFTPNASKIGATNVYSQLAEGNINNTISSLKRDRIELTQEKGILAGEDRHARNVARDAAKSFHKAKILQAQLKGTLAQVKGQIATFVDQAEAAATASSAGALASAQPVPGFPPPPPDSAANIAIRTAESFLGVPYVWGGASRSGVDCSGLIMLAYDAAGIDFPHYSGAMYEDTERVPLYDIQPGDLLFYGPGGDEHVAMYVGHGMMIEAPETGEVVHITPVRLYGDFVGLGRPR